MGYLHSPYFKDLYLYLAQNKLPSSKSATCKVEVLAERNILLDSLLFKLNTTPEKEKALLAIPEICVDSNNYNVSFKFVCWAPRFNKTYLKHT